MLGKISAQPHTIVKQICFPNGDVLFLSLFSLSKNWMHNVVWGCAEILPNALSELCTAFSSASPRRLNHSLSRVFLVFVFFTVISGISISSVRCHLLISLGFSLDSVSSKLDKLPFYGQVFL